MTVTCAELAYPEPQQPQTSSLSPIYRDGNWLGVPRDNPDFQERCIKSNSSVEVTPTVVDTCYIPSHGIWPLITFVLGPLFSEMMLGKKVKLVLPISADWMASWKRSERINKALIVGGMFGIVFGAFFCCVAMVIDERLGLWLLYSLAIFPLVSIVVLICQYVRYRYMPIARVRYIDDRFVWISGVDPAYLEGLPEIQE